MSYEFPEHVTERQRRVYRTNDFRLVRDARRKVPVAQVAPQGIADAEQRFQRVLLRLGVLLIAAVSLAAGWWLHGMFR